MPKNHGAEIEQVSPQGAASVAGLLPGDIVTSINGHRIGDAVDFLFFTNPGEELHITAIRNDKKTLFRIPPREGQDIGISLKPFKVRTCTNRCIFCFVNQLPKGCRKTLYLKDEDYRMSFLYGNYITLTNLTAQDKKRIVEQRLGPLYLSVHATDRALRNSMLGNQKAPDILKELGFFKEHKIKMHCQVVLCPGINDGKHLRQTIRDLYRFYPYVSSVAVVPVGLTAHRKTGPKLTPVEKADARSAIETVALYQKRFKKKHGDPIVYGSDELYIKAGQDFPALRDYGDLPQLENGVGMVPLFIHQAKKIKSLQAAGKQRFVTFTGISFYPFLSAYIEKLRKHGADIELIAVENAFFGKSVTVTGLLSGRDVIRALSGVVRKEDLVFIPDVVMREGSDLFLDDVSKRNVEEILGVRTEIIESTPKGLTDAVASFS